MGDGVHGSGQVALTLLTDAPLAWKKKGSAISRHLWDLSYMEHCVWSNKIVNFPAESQISQQPLLYRRLVRINSSEAKALYRAKRPGGNNAWVLAGVRTPSHTWPPMKVAPSCVYLKKKMCFEKLLPHDTLLDPVGQNLRLQGFPTPLPMRGLIIYPKPSSASSSDSWGSNLLASSIFPTRV
jgi:hypothetical protein